MYVSVYVDVHTDIDLSYYLHHFTPSSKEDGDRGLHRTACPS